MLLALGLGGGGAVVAGALLGFVGQFFSLVILFPLVLGGVAGFGARQGIKSGKVRSPLVGLLVGVAVGLVGAFAEATWQYQRTRSAMRAALKDVPAREQDAVVDRALVALGAARHDEDEAAFRQQMERPDAPGSLEVWNGWLRNQWRHTSISRGGSKGTQLGLTGGMVLWGVELLITVGVATTMAFGATREPFCEDCGSWFGGPVSLAAIPGHFGPDLVRALQADDRDAIRRLCEAEASMPPLVALSAQLCQCPEGDLFVRAVRVEKDGKGNNREKELASGLSARQMLSKEAPPGASPADEQG